MLEWDKEFKRRAQRFARRKFGNLEVRAQATLGNPAEWKTHLEALSDDDLRAMSPQFAFCGLFDRIERVNRVYDEEVARRRLLK